MVGDYSLTSATPCCAAGTHGFLLSGGQFSTFDVPDSTLTYAGAINPQGDIAGAYSTSASGGFLLSDGDLTLLDVPGATLTNTLGINERGDMVGRYVAGGVSHGYLLTGGRCRTASYPRSGQSSTAPCCRRRAHSWRGQSPCPCPADPK